jgi:MFS transporter, DHA1 family, multidrug resistance protein
VPHHRGTGIHHDPPARVTAARANLAIVAIAGLLGNAGMALVIPFVPLFLLHDLEVRDPASLALWTGSIAAANGVVIVFASPFWGSVGDRHGRKRMLVRALAGSATFVGLLAATTAPWQMVAARLGLGAVTGVMPTSSAILAAQTPRHQLGWALGVLASAFAVGGAVGPFVGALAAPAVGVRGVFLIAGALIAVGALLVVFGLREPPVDATVERPHVVRELRAMDGATLRAIAILIASQALLWMFFNAAQPVLALRVLELRGPDAGAITGVLFGVIGATSAVAALAQASLTRRSGYRAVAFGGVVFGAVAILAAATTADVDVLVIAGAAMGVATGTLMPSLSGLLGLRTPPRLVGTVFGMSNSATAVGFSVGPFVTGLVAASAGAAPAIAITVVPLAAMAVVLAFVRE